MAALDVDLSDFERWTVEYRPGVVGVFNAMAIRHLVAAGFIKPDSMVTQQVGQWEPLHKVPQLVPVSVCDDLCLAKYQRADTPRIRRIGER